MRVFNVGARRSNQDFRDCVATVRDEYVNFFGKKYEALINERLNACNYVLLGVSENIFRSENLYDLSKKIGVNFERGGKRLAASILTQLPKFQEKDIYEILRYFMSDNNYEKKAIFYRIYDNFVKYKGPYASVGADHDVVSKLVWAFKDYRKELAEYAILEYYYFPLKDHNVNQKDVINELLNIFAPKTTMTSLLSKWDKVFEEIKNGDVVGFMKDTKIKKEAAEAICDTYYSINRKAEEMRYKVDVVLPQRMIESGFGDLVYDINHQLDIEYRARQRTPEECVYDEADCYMEQLNNHASGFVFPYVGFRKNWLERICVIDYDNNLDTVESHEFAHVISCGLTTNPRCDGTIRNASKGGFAINGEDSFINELFTEYCAMKSSGIVDNRSSYQNYLQLVEPLFDEFRQDFIDAYLGPDLSPIYRRFGRENFEQLHQSLNELYKKTMKNSDIIKGFIDYDLARDEKKRDEILKSCSKIVDRNHDQLNEATLMEYCNLIEQVKYDVARLRDGALDSDKHFG